jgi:RimJ/RimL family protein N-acetyltransferase
VKLETARLVLRPPTEDDADAFAESSTDPEVMRYIGDGGLGSREGSLNAIRKYRVFWEQDQFGIFVLERRDDGVVIGRTGLQAWNPADWRTGARSEIGATAEIEIGWILARRHWGHGYATEAAIAVRDWAFRDIGVQRLISLIHPANDVSIRVAEKIGEHYEKDVMTGAGNPARVYAIDAHSWSRRPTARGHRLFYGRSG